MSRQALMVLVVALMVTAHLAVFSSPVVPIPGIPSVHAATVPITLTGCAVVIGSCSHAGWNGTTASPNPKITVQQGDMVTLSLSSADGITHQFVLDVDGDGADTSDCTPTGDQCSALFSTTTSSSFTVGASPATYTYLCSIHPSTMFGSFTVNPSGTVGGSTVPVNKLMLLAPYLGFASLIAAATALCALFVRRFKSDKTNN